MADADRVFLILKGHMRRLRDQFGVMLDQKQHEERVAVSDKFQFELARVWEQYLAVGEALATDNSQEAQRYSAALRSAVDTVDSTSLTDRAKSVWNKHQADLDVLINKLDKPQAIETMRAEFAPLSQQIGKLVRTFGLEEARPIYELHCPMAFQGKGAMWYQASDQVRNPYFGSTMLTCADRVLKVMPEASAVPAQPDAPMNHSQHGTVDPPDRDD